MINIIHFSNRSDLIIMKHIQMSLLQKKKPSGAEYKKKIAKETEFK